jgi:ketosteroid isomerase-like protein
MPHSPERSDEAGVLAANAAFYDAFRGESLAGMDAVWSRRAPVACIHPGWPALFGRARVMASWRAIFESGAPAIRCDSPTAHIVGDTAFVICAELLSEGRLIATNLFVREDGAWRMVHHQAGPITAPSDDADGDEPEPGSGLN